MPAVNFKRNGFHTITTYLMVKKVDNLIEFISTVFEGSVISKVNRTDGSIMHVEMKIGDSMIMMGEPREQDESMTAALYIYVENCDDVFKRAIRAGGTEIMEPMTMHHAGERYGGVKDPCGNQWWIATHVEDISLNEQKRRITEMGL